MRKLVANEFMTLDGVAQAPGGREEDADGGFKHGGWHMQFLDDLSERWVKEALASAGGFLLGRRTYEIFAAYWPNAPVEEKEYAEPLNSRPKYVVSTTLTEPLKWRNSRLLRGDVAQAVRALKQEEGGDLHVIGSTALVRALLEYGLVDELRLMIDPLTVGGGKRFFPDDGRLRPMRLAYSRAITTGAIMASYVAEGAGLGASAGKESMRAPGVAHPS